MENILNGKINTLDLLIIKEQKPLFQKWDEEPAVAKARRECDAALERLYVRAEKPEINMRELVDSFPAYCTVVHNLPAAYFELPTDRGKGGFLSPLTTARYDKLTKDLSEVLEVHTRTQQRQAEKWAQQGDVEQMEKHLKRACTGVETDVVQYTPNIDEEWFRKTSMLLVQHVSLDGVWEKAMTLAAEGDLDGTEKYLGLTMSHCIATGKVRVPEQKKYQQDNGISPQQPSAADLKELQELHKQLQGVKQGAYRVALENVRDKAVQYAMRTAARDDVALWERKYTTESIAACRSKAEDIIERFVDTSFPNQVKRYAWHGAMDVIANRIRPVFEALQEFAGQDPLNYAASLHTQEGVQFRERLQQGTALVPSRWYSTMAEMTTLPFIV